MAETYVEEIITPTEISAPPLVTEGLTKPASYDEIGGGYVVYEDKLMRKDALKELRPELFTAKADLLSSQTNFGAAFPRYAHKGDIFVRVDMLPNRVFKFDGKKWIEVNKEVSGSYLHHDDYLRFLIAKISSGEYDIELLTEHEKNELEHFLKTQNN